jgi:hypothetical protein
MFHILITFDYELRAGGCGDVRQLMIGPTAELLETCEKHGAKATLMPEIGELWAFEKPDNAGYKDYLGYDPGLLVRQQLVDAACRGHDVQLQVHPQWIRARWESSRWNLDYAHYQLTDFDDAEMVEILRLGKEDLENLLRPYCPDYRCQGFRAGHWNTQPSQRYLAALRDAGLRSDTSVFKWGYATNAATAFDYRSAWSNLLAWYARADDINQPTSEPTILEVPIATELVRFFLMLTPLRIRRSLWFLREDREVSDAVREAKDIHGCSSHVAEKLKHLFREYPRKLDFCKLTAREMLSSMENLINQFQSHADCLPVPIVMIGHSKEFDSAADLSKVLGTMAREFAGRVQFSTYRGFLEDYATSWESERLSRASAENASFAGGVALSERRGK